jgi:hypothetical protein
VPHNAKLLVVRTYDGIEEHYAYETAINTLCMQRIGFTVETWVYGRSATCALCSKALASIQMEMGVVVHNERCLGTNRNGLRCGRDATEHGYCPSHQHQNDRLQVA